MLDQLTGIDDARMMFDQTVITYQGNPVFIESLKYQNKSFVAECFFIGSGQRMWLPLDEKNFNFRPVTTGFVNIRGRAIYISRFPFRRYKQGLHVENMKVFNLTGAYFEDRYDVASEAFSKQLISSLRCKELYNTFKNTYPSLSDAIEMFEDGAVCVAFDRQFAIEMTGNLFFKEKIVGSVDFKTKKITFKKGFSYLRLALRENYEI